MPDAQSSSSPDSLPLSGELLRALREQTGLSQNQARKAAGVGQSSLAQLSRLGPLDELKIDKALIDAVVDRTTAQRIVAAVIDLAVDDGLTVVAEGVEQIEQRDRLNALGCPVIQGFLYSPPVPAGEFGALLAAPTPLAVR